MFPFLKVASWGTAPLTLRNFCPGFFVYPSEISRMYDSSVVIYEVSTFFIDNSGLLQKTNLEV